MRHVGDEPLAFAAPAPQQCHVGLCPDLVNEDPPPDGDARLVFPPEYALSCNIRPLLLGDVNAFFKAQVFEVNKLPHCLVVNLEAPPFQLGGQALQGKITSPALKSSGIDAIDLAEEIEKLLARFPNAKVNTDEQRQLRASLYRPLISLPKDARAGVVDLIMANVLGE